MHNGWSPVICSNMDRTDHYVKWNGPDTERQILHVFICGGKTVDHREVEIEQSSLEVREGGEEWGCWQWIPKLS
jgi:hypothetical protein